MRGGARVTSGGRSSTQLVALVLRVGESSSVPQERPLSPYRQSDVRLSIGSYARRYRCLRVKSLVRTFPQLMLAMSGGRHEH